MKQIFKGIIANLLFVSYIFSMSSEELKKEHDEIIKHLLNKVFVYNESTKTFGYKTLFQEKGYLDSNPYHDKHLISSHIPDDQADVIYRLFKNNSNAVAFVCAEDRKHKIRYFVDNNNDNVCYILYDEDQIGKKYFEDTLSHEEKKEIKDCIDWAVIVLAGLNKTTNIDSTFFSKLKKFPVIHNKEICNE